MSIETKTIAALLDELITTSNRAWHAQDAIMDQSLTDAGRLNAAEIAQTANARRCALMRAIDARLGEGAQSGMKKTYA